MRNFGWGESDSGHMIYKGPVSVSDVFSHLQSLPQRVLIGDDMQGHCLGYDFELERFGEYSPRGEWSDFDDAFKLIEYLASVET